MVGSRTTSSRIKRRLPTWRVLVLGFLLYLLALAILILTGNPNLFPTVVLIGNFLVPVAYVSFFYGRQRFSDANVPRIASSFLYGGILGTLAAAIVEPLVIRRFDFQNAFLIGFIEELAKILGVMLIARRRQHHLEIDGFMLGAAAGMGFAAFESTGYAFTAFLESGGSLSVTVGVTLLRGLLSPLGHGTWTAILASVMFRESRDRPLTLNLRVLLAFVTVVVLHGLWDGVPPLIAALVGSGIDVFLSQALIGAAGVIVLWLRWREARRQLAAEAAAETADRSPGEKATAGGEAAGETAENPSTAGETAGNASRETGPR